MVFRDIDDKIFSEVSRGNGYTKYSFKCDLKNRKKLGETFLDANKNGRVAKIIDIAGCLDSHTGNIILGDGFTAISAFSFSREPSVTGFDASGCHSLKNISHKVFSEDDNLRKVALNEGLETIDAQAFEWCLNLGNIWLPFSLNRLNEKAFDKSGLRVIVCGEEQYPTVEKLYGVQFLSMVFVVDRDYYVKKVHSLKSRSNDRQDVFTMKNIIETIENLIAKNPANATNNEVIAVANRVPVNKQTEIIKSIRTSAPFDRHKPKQPVASL